MGYMKVLIDFWSILIYLPWNKDSLIFASCMCSWRWRWWCRWRWTWSWPVWVTGPSTMLWSDLCGFELIPIPFNIILTQTGWMNSKSLFGCAGITFGASDRNSKAVPGNSKCICADGGMMLKVLCFTSHCADLVAPDRNSKSMPGNSKCSFCLFFAYFCSHVCFNNKIT